MFITHAFPYIRGQLSDIFDVECVPFDDVEPLSDALLPITKPNLYDGIPAASIKDHIREDLADCIQPSKNNRCPLIPNIIVEAKYAYRYGEGVELAQLQACDNGALGARAMHDLRSYGKDPETMYDENTYTICATYAHWMLVIFLHHVTPTGDVERPAKYHMSPIGSWSLLTDCEAYRKAVTAFRNGP